MTTVKSLMLSGLTALSLVAGTAAMAQESAGGVGFGPWETQQLEKALSNNRHAGAVVSQPQAGASDVEQMRAPLYPQQVLFGQDGNG